MTRKSNQPAKAAKGSKSQGLAPEKAAPVATPAADDAVTVGTSPVAPPAGEVAANAEAPVPGVTPETGADAAPPMADLQSDLVGANTPPDLDGDGKPGGSVGQLAWETAQVANAACFTWSVVRPDPASDGAIGFGSWGDLSGAERLRLAIEAKLCIADADYAPAYFQGPAWESVVRNRIFAAVVRSIALG